MARFEAFWEVACDFRPYMWLGFQVCIFLFVLAVISLLFARPGSSAEFLSYVNFSLVLFLGAWSGGMYLACARRAKRHY